MQILPTSLINFPSDEHKEKVEKFAQYVNLHERIRPILSEAVHGALCAPAGKIIAIIGVTGAGKSTVSLLAHRCINEYYRNQMENNPGLIPVITVSLFHPEDPRSAWRSMYMGINEEVEPLSHKKQADTNSSAFIQQSQRQTALALRKAAQSVIRNRGVKLLQIDEGDALIAAVRGLGEKYQAAVLKSFLNTTKVPCIVYAPYSFYQAIRQDRQMSRRVTFIHLQPYGASEDETLAFLKIAEEFLEALPLPAAPDLLEENADFIVEKTLGCVGLLKRLFQDALVAAYHARARQVRTEHLKKAALMEGVLEGMRLDIANGAILFGQNPPPVDSDQAKSKGSTRKPGNRNPTRDPLVNPQRGLV